jgi:hypothetical protein
MVGVVGVGVIVVMGVVGVGVGVGIGVGVGVGVVVVVPPVTVPPLLPPLQTVLLGAIINVPSEPVRRRVVVPGVELSWHAVVPPRVEFIALTLVLEQVIVKFELLNIVTVKTPASDIVQLSAVDPLLIVKSTVKPSPTTPVTVILLSAVKSL